MIESAEQTELDSLLERSDAFEEAMSACFPAVGLVLAESSQQHELVAAACALSIEHAVVLRAAFGAAAPNSGSAVLRLQYEALLRAAWLLYAATPAQVDKLGRILDLDAEQSAKSLPGYMEMLEAVVKNAPQGLSAPLAEFNQYSRHALNSFVHSGIHPLRRARDGFPMTLAITAVRFSNGLIHLAYRTLASLTRSKRRMDRVTHLYKVFNDCLPMMANSAGTSR
jgi:hypothetical protein